MVFAESVIIVLCYVNCPVYLFLNGYLFVEVKTKENGLNTSE